MEKTREESINTVDQFEMQLYFLCQNIHADLLDCLVGVENGVRIDRVYIRNVNLCCRNNVPIVYMLMYDCGRDLNVDVECEPK